MITVHNVFKSYPVRNGSHRVLNGLDFTVYPSEKIGILGRNGAGKSTFIRILSGAEQPTSGSVCRNMSLSWPLAFGGGFQGSLTGLDNLKFVCRIYGVDYRYKVDYVQDFAELGQFFREPVKNYSAGMMARLAFAISLAIDFDCFLIDEITVVGDARFHEKCHIELFEKRKDRAFVMVSHNLNVIREHCSKIGILVSGKIKMFDDIDEGYEYYNNNF